MLTMKLQGNMLLIGNSAGQILDIEEKETENEVVMTLKGKLISETSHPIQDEVEALVSVGKTIAMDFKEVSYISPSVMNVLLNAQMLADNFFNEGEIVLKHVPSAVFLKMQEAGVSDQLLIEE